MKQLTSHQIRQMYLDFFQEKDHQLYPSASLVPINDPTLLWINSGVAALKKYFDGSKKPANPRITNSQKSIRTNDIENVGVTARHHTLFEMLGNFSIGEYFKKEAIEWAWEFMTDEKWLGFDPKRLYVTYYPEDTTTRDLWLEEIGLSEDHVIPHEDNFWDIGAGPCGPNSEIFYDRGPEYLDIPEDDPENYPGGENERWLEVWNLVFSEFNHLHDDTYEPLPNKNIDTGMGLERLVSVIQDTPTNFETDLFLPIIRKIETLTDVKYDTAGEQQMSFKVIADHIRAVTFAVADGALPSNEGRGYILRRLIRRSVLHARRLKITDNFLARLVPAVIEVMGDFYTDLAPEKDFVQRILTTEEQRFAATIEEGQALLDEVIGSLREAGQSEISGAQAFQMYDTYGFPLELTVEMAQEEGFSVDEAGFDVEMEAQRERARAARSDEESMSAQSKTLQNINADFEFLGYTHLEAPATLTAIVVNDELQDYLAVGQEGWVFVNQSPFYAEAGGQVADAGAIYAGDTFIGKVQDVQKAPNGQNMHLITPETQDLRLNETYQLVVDRDARLKTNQNHSATHLLHKALSEVLGDHAHQAGSYVGPDRLRFDFSHYQPVTDEELARITEKINQWIYQAIPVATEEMSLETAKETGAMMLFGENYGDQVRVVDMSGESIELCGGTHVVNTSEIGTFKLLSESGIGAGIRRIEAITGQAAIQCYQASEDLLDELKDRVRAQEFDQIGPRIERLQEEIKKLRSENESLNDRLLQGESQNLFADVQKAGEVTYLGVALEGQSMDALRSIGDKWRQEAPSQVLVLAVKNDDRANLMVFVEDATANEGLAAGQLIKPLAQLIGGGGGGRATQAQAGGKDPSGIEALLAAIPSVIEDLYNK